MRQIDKVKATCLTKKLIAELKDSDMRKLKDLIIYGLKSRYLTHLVLNGTKRRAALEDGKIVYFENNWIKLALKDSQLNNLSDVVYTTGDKPVRVNKTYSKESRRYRARAYTATFTNAYVKLCASADDKKDPFANGCVSPTADPSYVGECITLLKLKRSIPDIVMKKLYGAIASSGNMIYDFRMMGCQAHICLVKTTKGYEGSLTLSRGPEKRVYNLINNDTFIYYGN